MNNKFKNVITLGGFIITLVVAIVVIFVSNNDDGEMQFSQGVTAFSLDDVEISTNEFSKSGESGEMGNEGNEAEDEDMITVFIIGAVNEPGVVKIYDGARLYEALELAGGAASDADLARVNLAEFVWDEEKVVIPYKNEKINSTNLSLTKIDNQKISTIVVTEPKENVSPPNLDYGAEYFNNYDANDDVDFKSQSENSKSTDATVNKKVNINTASASELETLTGIGPSTATKIIEYRESNGKFKSIDEIKNVKSIGDAKFNKIKDDITI